MILSMYMGYHDSAIAVFGEARLGVYEYERYTGRRFDHIKSGSDAIEFIEYCLASEGVSPDEVDRVIVVSADGYPPGLATSDDGSLVRVDSLATTGEQCFDLTMHAIRDLSLGDEVYFVEHHFAHATLAAETGRMKDGLVLAADGGGSHQHSALYQVSDGDLSLLHANALPVNWGKLYRQLPAQLIRDFRGGRYEVPGKAMALAGLAEPDESLVEEFLALLEKSEGDPDAWGKAAVRAFLGSSDSLSASDTAAWVLCASLQQALEKSVIEVFSAGLPSSRGDFEIGVSGGLALNGVLNERIRSELNPTTMTVPFAPGDGGLVLGGLSAVLRNDGAPAPDLSSPFLGAPVGSAEQLASFERSSVDDIASRLVDGQVVAMIEGRAEVGPRALGHRSIVALPESRESKLKLNQIKNREWYRPVSPVIHVSDMERYFGVDLAVPFMSYVLDWLPDVRGSYPGGVHFDGTARVQTISDQDDGLFPDLLRTLRDMGHPVLLNTSLNAAGQSLHQSLDQTIRMRRDTEIDFVATRRDQNTLTLG